MVDTEEKESSIENSEIQQRLQENSDTEEQEKVEYSITEDIHTKTGAKIWVVKPENRLDKDNFAKVRQKLAAIQGYYSTYKKGFIFKYDPTEKLATG